MKKGILSLIVIMGFGTYVAFLRSGDIAQIFSNTNPIPIENPINSINKRADEPVALPGTTPSNDKVSRTTNCVYIPDDEEREREDDTEDDERSEGKSTGHYKCTTTIVPAPTPSPSPVATTPAPTPTPTTPTPPPATKPKNTGMYKDGTYIGDTVDAFYGNVQVSATIADSRLTNVTFLDYPRDRQTSLQKSNHAMPILKSEAIASQSANVNSVSGATYTSEAFMMSLDSALTQAKNI